MPVDTSMYGSAQQPNALDMIGKFATIQNATNANKLFGQEFAARQAMGPIIQGAIDPASGQLDTNKLLQGLAANPATAFKAPELAKQALEMQAQQTSIANAQQTAAMQRIDKFNQVVAPLADKGAGVTHGDVADGLAELVAHKVFTVGQAADALKTVPAEGPQLVSWVKQHADRGLTVAEQLQQRFGTATTQNTGGQLVSGVQLPAAQGGGFRPASATNLTLSPGQAVTPQTVTGADGQPITGPTATFAPPGLVPPAARGAGGAPASTTTGGAPGSTAPAIPGAGGAPVVGQSPQQAQATEADVKAFKADQAAVPAAQTNVQSLGKALHALELTNAGKSTEATHAMYSFLNSQGLITPGLADDVKNYDLFKKYTTDYARKAATGAGTNLQLEASQASNAGPSISTQANLDVLKTNIGRERQRVAQVMEVPDQTGKGYGAHASRFASETDPRAFAFDTYSPAERKALVAGMKPAELAKFDRSLEIAHKHGLISTPTTAPQVPLGR